MDGLLAEINSKKKALTELERSEAGPSKYMKRADIERAREEEERKKREEIQRKRERDAGEGSSLDRASKLRKEAESSRSRLGSSPAGSSRNTPELSTSTPEPRETSNITPEECTRRLRSRGQPVRLFGETDKDRRSRLRALELLEERGGGGGRTNEFTKTLAALERSTQEKEAAKHNPQGGVRKDDIPQGGEAAGGKDKKKEERVEVGLIDLSLVKTDPNELYPLIYYALKNVLREWEEWMDARPDDVKRSGQGKMATGTQVQSAQNLKPLFKQLRGRDMLPDVVRLLAEIVHHMQSRQYQKANDAYLRLSIGNAAWPIGVTSVGIHERNARERIGEDVIAHVLNDEVSRKWIQAVKRLLTFSQTVRPPAELSQMMG